MTPHPNGDRARAGADRALAGADRALAGADRALAGADRAPAGAARAPAAPKVAPRPQTGRWPTRLRDARGIVEAGPVGPASDRSAMDGGGG